MPRPCRIILWSLCLAMLAACSAPPASSGGFDSDNPASRLYAIRRAGENKDRSKIPNLVQELDSDDPAVRMMSINALDRITGQRLGYNPYVDTPARQQAIAAWVKAVNEHRFESVHQ